eukprot:s3469_g4.t1
MPLALLVVGFCEITGSIWGHDISAAGASLRNCGGIVSKAPHLKGDGDINMTPSVARRLGLALGPPGTLGYGAQMSSDLLILESCGRDAGGRRTEKDKVDTGPAPVAEFQDIH